MTSHEIGDSMFFVETIPAVVVDKKYSTIHSNNNKYNKQKEKS